MDSLSSIKQYVNWATSKGIVVELEYHAYDRTVTGSALNTVTAWYGRLAAAFKGNPYVWFGTQNEPPDTSGNVISSKMTAICGAIRNAGNTARILLCPHGGGDDAQGMSASAIAGMKNVGWDIHCYNWVSGDSTSLSRVRPRNCVSRVSGSVGDGRRRESVEQISPHHHLHGHGIDRRDMFAQHHRLGS